MIDNEALIQKLKLNLLNVVIIIVSIFCVHYLYQVGLKNKNTMLLQKENEQKKNDVLTGISKVVDQIQLFKEAVNNKNIGGMLDTFSSIAKNNSVTINSVKPLEPVTLQYYNEHSFSLDITADSYHTVGKFIGELESSPFFFSVDNLNVGELEFNQDESTSIRVLMDVHTILVN